MAVKSRELFDQHVQPGSERETAEASMISLSASLNELLIRRHVDSDIDLGVLT